MTEQKYEYLTVVYAVGMSGYSPMRVAAERDATRIGLVEDIEQPGVEWVAQGATKECHESGTTGTITFKVSAELVEEVAEELAQHHDVFEMFRLESDILDVTAEKAREVREMLAAAHREIRMEAEARLAKLDVELRDLGCDVEALLDSGLLVCPAVDAVRVLHPNGVPREKFSFRPLVAEDLFAADGERVGGVLSALMWALVLAGAGPVAKKAETAKQDA